MNSIIKILFCSIIFLSYYCVNAQQNVGIGTLTPNPKAVLEIDSPDKGILVPRLSTADRTAYGATLTNLENSMLVFDNQENIFYYWNNGVWSPIPGIATDDQNLTNAVLNPLDSILTISIENGMPVTVDLKSAFDNSDNQNLTSAVLNPLDSILTISIENGTPVTVDLRSAFDGVDEQTLMVVGDSLEISNGNRVLFIDNDTNNEAIDSVTYLDDTLTVYEGNTFYKTEIVGGEWSDADRIGGGNFIYAKQALNNGTSDTISITDDGKIGFSTTNPLTELDMKRGKINFFNGGSVNFNIGMENVGLVGLAISNTFNNEVKLKLSPVGGTGNSARLLIDNNHTNTTVPMYSFLNDINTGISGGSGDNNILKLITDGNEVVRVDSNVGIGTTSPLFPLTVLDTNRPSNRLGGILVDGGTSSSNPSTTYQSIKTAGGTIGLHVGVLSDVRDPFLNYLGNESQSYLYSYVNSDGLNIVSQNDSINFYTNGGADENSIMTLLPNQNVGIGTKTPTNRLQINGDVRVGVAKNLAGGAVEPEGWGNVIHFSGGPDVSPTFNNDNSDGISIGRYNITGDLSELRVRLADNFGTANNDAFVIGSGGGPIAYNPYFRVQSNGFTGIGTNPTTYPTNQLHVIAVANPLRLEGLNNGASSDSALTVNNTGVVRKVANPTPAGSVISFAGATAPDGFLICDGAAVSRTTYADLFAVIGTTYGAGNGTTTFNVPDLRGEFVRGLDAGKGTDPGRALGSNQFASPVVGDDNTTPNDYSMQVAGSSPQFFDNYDAAYNAINFWYSTAAGGYQYNPSNGGGFLRASRPRNVALNYIIRF